jgi:hypothetical protein
MVKFKINYWAHKHTLQSSAIEGNAVIARSYSGRNLKVSIFLMLLLNDFIIQTLISMSAHYVFLIIYL